MLQVARESSVCGNALGKVSKAKAPRRREMAFQALKKLCGNEEIQAASLWAAEGYRLRRACAFAGFADIVPR